MFKVTKFPHGTISWADCVSTDVEKAKPFYANVLGWDIQDVPMGNDMFYTMYQVDGAAVAGLGPMPPGVEGMPSLWNNYVTVDDVDALVEKVSELGGKVLDGPFDVFESGRMASIQDPTGAVIALWQPKNHIGAGIVNTVGAMCWNELITSDLDKAKKFYEDLFGWTFTKMEGMDYWVAANNGRVNAGVMPRTEEMGDMPSNWSVYFNVADIDEALKKVEENGGKRVTEIMGTMDEGSPGRFAVVADPAGAYLNLIQATQADTWQDPE